ncbi:MAG: PAS domain S-box protein [candidate division KSB1 bacterium]|nr:PAS domain S-box protein [candidate division KSB1 bacterium]
MLKNLNDIIYIVQYQKETVMGGRIKFLTKHQIKEITGFSAEDFENDPFLWERIIHPDDIGVVLEHTLEIIANHKAGIRTYRLQHKTTGRWIWIEDKIVPNVNEQGEITAFLGIARDITEQKQKEELYVQIANNISSLTGNDFFKSFVRFFSNHFALYCALLLEFTDYQEKSIRPIAIFWDNQWLSHLDYSLEHSPARLALQSGMVIYTQGIQQFFPKDRFLAGHGIDSFAAITLKDAQHNIIGLLIGMDRKPIKDPAGIEHFLKIFSGRLSAEMIRKRTEEALHGSEKRLRAIFENAQNAILLLNDEGLILDANPAASKLTGHELFELRQQNIQQWVPPPDLRFFKRGWKLFKQNGYAQGSLTLNLKNNEPLVVEYKAIAEIIPGIHLVLVGDVTERNLQEKAILEFTDRERINIGREIHDGLGQYLTGMELLAKALAKKLERKGLMEEQKNATELLALAEKVSHQVSIIASGLPEALIESTDIHQIFSDYSKFIEDTFHVKCDFTCTEPFVIKNTLLITQLFRIAQEAIHNAIKHGQANQISIELKRKNGNYLLEISDDGVGIPSNIEEAMGVGIRSMIYRARTLHGTINFLKNTSGGTLIQCTFPPKILNH